jgi:hypothetical protein
MRWYWSDGYWRGRTKAIQRRGRVIDEGFLVLSGSALVLSRRCESRAANGEQRQNGEGFHRASFVRSGDHVRTLAPDPEPFNPGFWSNCAGLPYWHRTAQRGRFSRGNAALVMAIR